MNALKRIKQIIAANINHMLEKAEDPEKMIKQFIREMDESIVRLRLEVAKAIAAEKRLARRVREAEESAQKWRDRAQKAVADGEEDVARGAIGKRLDAATALKELKAQRTNAETVSGTMKEELRQLENKIQEARRRKEILIARKRSAEAQKAVLDTTESFRAVSRHADSLLTSVPEAAAGIDSMEEAISDLEADAEARRELLAESRNVDDLAEKRERRSAIEEELQDLKSRLEKP